ncbi:MAG: zinc-dependent metalloprotease family protein, partial [Anaerolineales bacterium]
MQHKRCPFLFSLVVGLLLTLFFVLPVIANVDTGWDWPDSGDGKPQRTLTYCVEGDDEDFKNDVDAAAAAWNGEGVGWTLSPAVPITDCENADVVVKQEDLGGTAPDGRITLGSCVVNGSEGAWQGTAQGGTISINSNADANWGDPANPDEQNRVRTIMHEFGHAMRLDHTFGAGDIMKQSTSTITGTAISDEDRREARTAANYTIGGTRVVGYVDPEA